MECWVKVEPPPPPPATLSVGLLYMKSKVVVVVLYGNLKELFGARVYSAFCHIFSDG